MHLLCVAVSTQLLIHVCTAFSADCRMMWEKRVSVAMVLGEEGGVAGGVWPREGEEVRHSLVVNGSWEHGALCVAGIQEYPGQLHTCGVKHTPRRMYTVYVWEGNL